MAFVVIDTFRRKLPALDHVHIGVILHKRRLIHFTLSDILFHKLVMMDLAIQNETTRRVLLEKMLNSDLSALYTQSDDGTISYDPVGKMAERVILCNGPDLDLNEQVLGLVTEIADRYLTADNREAEITTMSVSDKVRMVMRSKTLANGEGRLFGENLDPEAAGQDTLNRFLREITADRKLHSEIYAYVPGEDGKIRFHRVDPEQMTPEKKPVELWNPQEKQQKISELRRLRLQVGAKGTTRRDSKEFREFKTALDAAEEKLRKTLDVEKKNKILKDLADKADRYYYAKLAEKQNDRRSVRFQAAAALRSIDRSDAPAKVDLKQCVLDKAAKLLAEFYLKSGKEEERTEAKEILEPYNREKLAEFSTKIGETQRFQTLLNNRSEKELKMIFDTYPDMEKIDKKLANAVKQEQPSVQILS